MSRFVELDLSPNNPSPIKQPFLTLGLAGSYPNLWEIEVDGMIDLYLRDFTQIERSYGRKIKGMNWTAAHEAGLPKALALYDWKSQATPLLEDMLNQFSSHGAEVHFVSFYNGSAGPSHILRNGAFFSRMSLSELPQGLALPHVRADIAPFLPLIFG